ncbi:WD40/YVTN/BNR-like repeat-containing protein [Paenibacillus rigui]|uniref:Photosynthesis system II assembly factor Ycf48/Hcf136-like domain-containing protein n=1 Tax=Paenibacillus rigui TaxID=554312 RepID=A0A229UW84_9BACL|nr:hypothetical protein [Paenibacillus rigui]OXM87694.1 hypothetical protein CF651_00815 [Paenibacillus rigui]
MNRAIQQPIALLFLILFLSFAAGCSSDPAPASVNPAPNAQQSGQTNAPEQGKPGDAASSEGTGNVNGSTNQQPSKPVSESGLMSHLTAVRAIDPSSGWVGGDGGIARTDDGGKQWKMQYSGKDKIAQIFALNGQDAWGMIEKSADGTKRELIQTSDGGAQWTTVGPLPNPGFVHFVSKQEGFAANAYTKDGGKSWQSLAVPDHMVGDAYFHDKTNGWAVTAEDKKILVKRTTDAGKSWTTVLSRDTSTFLNGTVIRSAGADDVWVELIGDSGMSQTSYSLFHSSDGGKNWQPVLSNSTAGAGPAPGFPADYTGTKNAGSKPGELYVVNPKAAFMGGYCPACDNPNTVGYTTDGGKTWVNGKEQIPGSSGAMLAISDPQNGWLISKDAANPSVLYTTADGGQHWKAVHTFDKPKQP